MFNRTLRRPMFRRGGKAEGGITSGLKRQGYADRGSVIQDDPTKLDTQECWKRSYNILTKLFLHTTMQVLIFS